MDKLIQISCLGNAGRFGNQLFQYAVAKRYAKLVGATLETPAWSGQKIFGFNDPPISKPLPKLRVDEIPTGQVNIDLVGWFRFHEAMAPFTYKELKEMFVVKPEWIQLWNDQAKMPRSYIACHLRRGDFIKLGLPIVDITCYWKQLVRLKIDPQKAVYVEESLQRTYEIEPELSFLPDFLTLMNANTLLRANSSFSWWAAALSKGKVFSPVLDERFGMQYTVPFVEGNWPKIMPSTRNSGRSTDIFLENE